MVFGFPAVGAVYDRASVAFKYGGRAVIDRAYSREGTGADIPYEKLAIASASVS